LIHEGCRSETTAPSGGLLVEANHVSRRVAEPCSDLWCIGADQLHDLGPVGDDHVNGCGYAVVAGSRTGALLRRSGLSTAPRFHWECLTTPFPAWAAHMIRQNCQAPLSRELTASSHFIAHGQFPLNRYQQIFRAGGVCSCAQCSLRCRCYNPKKRRRNKVRVSATNRSS
jgi:hypothetical protein